MRKAAMFLILAGCAAGGSAQYTETDNQKTITTDLGNTFYVSLPAERTAKPSYSQNILTLANDSIDMSQRRTLEFSAKALGETEIRVGAGFSLRVQVLSASDRPGMHLNH